MPTAGLDAVLRGSPWLLTVNSDKVRRHTARATCDSMTVTVTLDERFPGSLAHARFRDYELVDSDERSNGSQWIAGEHFEDVTPRLLLVDRLCSFFQRRRLLVCVPSHH
jgi:hypothetical protein